MTKRIIAIELGFAPGRELRRVRPGTILEVPDDFKGSWFRVVDDEEPASKAKAKAKSDEPVALSQLAKTKAKGPTDPLA